MLVLGASRLTDESTFWANCTLQPSNMRPWIIWTDNNLQGKSAKSVKTCKPPHAFTRFNLEKPNHPTWMCLSRRRRPEYPERTHTGKGNMQTPPTEPLHSRGFNPRTFFLQGNSPNHRTTVKKTNTENLSCLYFIWVWNEIHPFCIWTYLLLYDPSFPLYQWVSAETSLIRLEALVKKVCLDSSVSVTPQWRLSFWHKSV